MGSLNTRPSNRTIKSLLSSLRGNRNANSMRPADRHQDDKQEVITSQKQAPGTLSSLSSTSVSNLVPQYNKGQRSTKPTGDPHKESSSRNNPPPVKPDSLGYQRIQQRRKRARDRDAEAPTEPQVKTPAGTEHGTARVSFNLPQLNDATFLAEEDADKPGESPTKQQRTDARRNAERVAHRDNRDKELMSKYLPPSLEDVFNETVEGPDDAFRPPNWLLKAIQEVATTPVPTPKAPPIKFATDAQSLADNAELLERFGWTTSPTPPLVTDPNSG